MAYDGTTIAALSGYTLTGFIGSQTVDASAASANFADKNAGVGKTVTIGGITLADGTNGGLASNYTVSSTATSTGTIDPKVLTLNVMVANKVYDGTTAATLLNNNVGLSGFVGNETVTGLYAGGATFADKNVGSSKAVTVTGIALINGANGGLGSGKGPGYGQSENGGFAGGIFNAGGGVTAPVLVLQVDPEYSDDARKAKYSGSVTLAIIVDTDGRPRDIRVTRSLGMGLDEKAIESVQKWRFKPGLRSGQPVNVRATVVVNFRLL